MRRRLTSLVTGLGILLALVAFAPAARASDEGDEWAFVAAINQVRVGAGLPALVPIAGLRDEARAQSVRLGQRGSLFHNPDLAAAVGRVLPDWSAAGENVGQGSDVPGLHDAFMTSLHHRENVLGAYRYVGVGVVHTGSTLWVTEVFAQAPAGRAALAAPAAGQSATSPTPIVPVTRLAGGDPATTSVAVANRFPVAGSSVVVVARSDVFADALAGGALAASGRGPVLMTTPGSVPAGLVVAARRVLRADGRVVLLGGTDALSPAVETTFRLAGLRVERVAGVDRYATAVAVAQQVSSSPSQVLLVSGVRFPDAMVAGPVAGLLDAPIVLAGPDRLPAATASYLDAHPGARVTVIGGTAAVSTAAADAAGAAERVYGSDREETAVRVAQRWFPGAASLSFANGGAFTDALAGAALSAVMGIPLLLVGSPPSSSVTSYVDHALGGLDTTLVYGTVVGDDLLGRLLS